MNEDFFVDVDDDVEDKILDFVADGPDEFIDIDDIDIDETFVFADDKARVKRFRYDAFGRQIGGKPADYVSFRYSRQDRDNDHLNNIPIEALDRFRFFQAEINIIAVSKGRLEKKRAAIKKLIASYQQELRGMNIRYRNLWRHLNTHEIVPMERW